MFDVHFKISVCVCSGVISAASAVKTCQQTVFILQLPRLVANVGTQIGTFDFLFSSFPPENSESCNNKTESGLFVIVRGFSFCIFLKSKIAVTID